jgi:hypothetical protein
MMTLYEKIISLYPELENQILIYVGIIIQNDSDGQGDYIAKWEHPTLQRPTDEQLAQITE